MMRGLILHKRSITVKTKTPMQEHAKLTKRMAKLDKEYDLAESMPIKRARILKRAAKTQKRLDILEGK